MTDSVWEPPANVRYWGSTTEEQVLGEARQALEDGDLARSLRLTLALCERLRSSGQSMAALVYR
jgi:hypothetical protein